MYTLKTLWLGTVFAFVGLLPTLVNAVPEIQHWRTENGARVYFVAAPELPMVDVQMVFDAGSARDGEQPGLAQLTSYLLDEGTATLSADAIAERLDNVGAQFGSGSARDMAWLSLRSLSAPEYLNPAIDTMALVLRAPAFAPASLERIRNRMIAMIREAAQSPGTIASQAFFKALYGQHPYASPSEGTEASLKAIAPEQVQAFHKRYYVAANVVVAIVGDLDRAAAERLVDTLVGELPTGKAAPPPPAVAPVTQAEVIRIEHPSSQSHILVGQVGMKRGDPDFFSLYLGNHVLGGNGLVSKLGEEVREKRGLSYSVYSSVSPMRQPGPFVIGLQTRNDQVDEALEVVADTLQGFVANGPDPKVLQEARQNITGGFALRIDSNRKIVQYLAMLGFYNLPLDYLNTFIARIDAISLEQVNDTLKNHIHPDRLITVIVGGA